MKISDLRTNNLVFVPSTNQTVPISMIDERTQSVVVNMSIALIHIDDIEPITLTEEILKEWFGFDDSEYKKGFIGVDFKSGMMTLDFVLTKPKKMGPWQTYYSFDLGQNRFTPVYFVHELQNLFEPVTRQQLKKIT